jgi:hypothetical protein
MVSHGHQGTYGSVRLRRYAEKWGYGQNTRWRRLRRARKFAERQPTFPRCSAL